MLNGSTLAQLMIWPESSAGAAWDLTRPLDDELRPSVLAVVPVHWGEPREGHGDPPDGGQAGNRLGERHCEVNLFPVVEVSRKQHRRLCGEASSCKVAIKGAVAQKPVGRQDQELISGERCSVHKQRLHRNGNVIGVNLGWIKRVSDCHRSS